MAGIHGLPVTQSPDQILTVRIPRCVDTRDAEDGDRVQQGWSKGGRLAVSVELRAAHPNPVTRLPVRPRRHR